MTRGEIESERLDLCDKITTAPLEYCTIMILVLYIDNEQDIQKNAPPTDIL